jgi:hypothetical protein
MRLIRLRLPILAVLVLAVSSVPIRAQVLYLETADWTPTVRVLALPTSYVVASTYTVPTTYTIPTVYATAYVTQSALLTPTTYLAPSYYETRFQRRGLFGRRLVETTRAVYLPSTTYYPTTYFYPTTFYSPTVLDTGVVPTGYTTLRSSDCCGGEVIAAVTPEVRQYSSELAPAASPPAQRNTTRPRQAPLRSQAADEEATDSNVPELPARESATRPESTDTTTGQRYSPPNPQVPTREQSTAAPTGSSATQTKPAAAGTTGGNAQPKNVNPRPGTSEPAKSAAPEPPKAPAGIDDLQAAPTGDETTGAASSGQRRVVQRYIPTTPRTLRSEYRNVLFGRVKARDTNEPEEGVRVTISNQTSAYADRVAFTDAFGRFAVKVPDGDWTVKVTMPSGRVFSVSQITVNNGMISDNIGRDIPSLVITR